MNRSDPRPAARLLHGALVGAGLALLAIALTAVFGWNGAALWDLRAGNVAIVGATLLWGAFGTCAAGRRTAFAALVVAASCLKLAPSA